jgi:hypothetical protein
MKLCRHPNVLSLHTSFVVENELWIVMPFMGKGAWTATLADWRASGLPVPRCNAIPLASRTSAPFVDPGSCPRCDGAPPCLARCAGSVSRVMKHLKERKLIGEGFKVRAASGSLGSGCKSCSGQTQAEAPCLLCALLLAALVCPPANLHRRRSTSRPCCNKRYWDCSTCIARSTSIGMGRWHAELQKKNSRSGGTLCAPLTPPFALL